MRAVNLIPAEQRGGAPVGAGRSEGAAYALLALFAGLAAMALLYGLASHQISSREKQAATLNAKTQQAQAATDQLAAYTSFASLRQQRAQAVEQLVDSRFDWAHAFHEFARVLPSDASITALSGTVGTTTASTKASASTPAASAVAAPSASAASASASGASGGAVASATPPGSLPTFTLSGCARSQAAVAETIGRLRLIDGVSSVTLQSSTKAGGAGSGSGAAGGCAASQPAYTVVIAFQPLPTPSASSSSKTTVVAATTSTGKGAAR